MSTRRDAPDTDLIWIEMILHRVRAQPADRGLAIAEWIRKRHTAFDQWRQCQMRPGLAAVPAPTK